MSTNPASPPPTARLLKWRSEHPEEYQAKRLAGLRASPKVVAAARMVHKLYKEKRMASRSSNPRCAKGLQNAAALIWRLRDPSGRAHEFKNLAEFVRQNAHLFEPHHVVWTRRGNGTSCLAYSGIAGLRPYKRNGQPKPRVEGSWFGWTWVSGIEDIETPRKRDLLDRREPDGVDKA